MRATKKRKPQRRNKYQCIGGPLCGVRVEMTNDGWLAVGSTTDPLEHHYYRMCVVEDQHGKIAQYWHYIGEEPHSRPPQYFPARRHFK